MPPLYYAGIHDVDFYVLLLFEGKTVPNSCNFILLVIGYATVPRMYALVSRTVPAQYMRNENY